MTKQKKIVLIVILVSVLLIGVGYAALTAVGVNITGNANATAATDNFKVKFVEVETYNKQGTNTTVAGEIQSDVLATIDVKKLEKVGDYGEAVFKIQNVSIGDITADTVKVKSVAGSDDNFEITATRCNADGSSVVDEGTDLTTAENDFAYVKVRATLKVAPVMYDVNTDKIAVEIEADPLVPANP